MTVAIRRIVFTTDFSAPAAHAQQYAEAFAGSFSAELFVLHVVDQQPLIPSPDIERRWVDDEISRARHQLKGCFLGQTHSPVLEVRAGAAAPTITQYAHEVNADLIVIGTHGRSGLSHLLLGSVAEKVVRLAECPVLTVHPRGHAFSLDRPA